MMKPRFLCANHRHALSENPGQAIHCWQNGFDTGQLLYEQFQWKEALPHLGCALETSEIILSTKAVDTLNACQLLTSSAILTANTLLRLGREKECQQVLHTSIDRLERELGITSESKPQIIHFVSCLYECLKNFSAFKQEVLSGLERPCSETSTVVH